MDTELYAVILVNEEGEFAEFAVGGGSSTKSRVRAFETYEEAARSMSRINMNFVDDKTLKPEVRKFIMEGD